PAGTSSIIYRVRSVEVLVEPCPALLVEEWASGLKEITLANEITINAILAYADSETASEILGIPANLQKNITTKRYSAGKMSVGTSDTVIPLGNIVSLGYYIFINRDATNAINFKTAAGGT